MRLNSLSVYNRSRFPFKTLKKEEGSGLFVLWDEKERIKTIISLHNNEKKLILKLDFEQQIGELFRIQKHTHNELTYENLLCEYKNGISITPHPYGHDEEPQKAQMHFEQWIELNLKPFFELQAELKNNRISNVVLVGALLFLGLIWVWSVFRNWNGNRF